MPRAGSDYPPEKRSSIMRSVRSHGTEAEIKLASALIQAGVKFRTQERLCGCKPDFILSNERVAVFVDGCFWHGCIRHRPTPKTNREFWLAKVRGNRQRDRRNSQALRAAGWTVVRIWEHTIVHSPARAVACVRRAITRAGATGLPNVVP